MVDPSETCDAAIRGWRWAGFALPQQHDVVLDHTKQICHPVRLPSLLHCRNPPVLSNACKLLQGFCGIANAFVSKYCHNGVK